MELPLSSIKWYTEWARKHTPYHGQVVCANGLGMERIGRSFYYKNDYTMEIRLHKKMPPNPRRKLYLLTILCHREKNKEPLMIAQDWLDMYCCYKYLNCGNQFMFSHDGDVVWIYNSLFNRGLGFTLVEMPPETFRSSLKSMLDFAFQHHLSNNHDYGDKLTIIE